MVTDFERTIDLLGKCSKSCDDFIESNSSGKAFTAKLQRLLMLVQDCTDICMITVEFVTRDSTYDKKLLRLCAEMCHKGADAFGKLQHEWKPHKDALRRCAEQCALVC